MLENNAVVLCHCWAYQLTMCCDLALLTPLG